MARRTVIAWIVVLGLSAGACKKGGESAGGGAGGTQTLQVQADPTQFKFQEATLEAKAGSPIAVAFENPSQQPHTWVLVKPGDEESVDQAAQASGGDATGVTGAIKATKVVSPGGSERSTAAGKRKLSYWAARTR